jgi:steroid delta-isomerase-like uncharacterized protein
MMSTQDNGQLARTFWNAFNTNQIDRGLELLAPDVVAQFIATGQTFRGPSGVREALQIWRTACPDMKVEITNTVATDTTVVTEVTYSGTQTGILRLSEGEIGPTGKKLRFNAVLVWEIRSGKIAHSRNYFDRESIVQQLGQVRRAA